MWGSFVVGSGKLFGRFLGSWTRIVCRRACSVLTRSAQELNFSPLPISCRVTLAKTLQKELGGKAEGRWWQQRGVSARGRAVKQNGPGSLCVRWCESWGRWQELFPWFCLQQLGNKEQPHWVSQDLFSLLLKADYLQTPWLTRCPSSASAAVSSKVNPGLWVWLSVSPPQGKSASSFPMATTGSVPGSSRWGCVGKDIRTTPGNNYWTSCYWEIFLDTLINCVQAPLEKKRCICSGATTVFGLLSYFLFEWGRKGDQNSVDFIKQNGPSKNIRFSLPHFR